MQKFYQANFPYKKGVYCDFQSDKDIVKLDQSSEQLKDFFTFDFKLFCYHIPIPFKDLVNTNLLMMIFDNITVLSFLSMTKEASKTLLHLMCLQIGGLNPYDLDKPLFGQYTTKSILDNLEQAKYYQDKLMKGNKNLIDKPERDLLIIQDGRLMLKLMLKTFSFPMVIELWTIYKYFLWTIEKKEYDFVLSSFEKIEQIDGEDLICKYLYLFYGTINYSLLQKVLKSLDPEDAAYILDLCIQDPKVSGSFAKVRTFYAFLVKEFNFWAF